MTHLQQIPARMAAAIAPLFSEPTRDRYIRFVQLMAHYTRHSGDELRRAAELMPSAELRALFSHLAHDEANHYRLAEADLEALGASLNGEVPDAVSKLSELWMSADALELVGALYALENVAAYVRSDAIECMQALELRPAETRFLATHLAADEEHGHALAEACRGLSDADNDVVVAGAERAADLWIAMHLEVV